MDGEFPSGVGAMSGTPQEEDYTKMNLEDRLSSKVWKARVSGYEELIRLFEKSPSENAPVFKPYTRDPTTVKAIATDSNAVAQEKGMEAIRAFLIYGGKAAGVTREVVMPSIIEKCFGAMRAGTKKLALEISLLYAEMEDIVGCEGLIQDLLKGTNAKQPKVIATSVIALSELMREYGPKQASPKLIVKKLPELFAHSDKTVRAEATNLAKELHKWIGAALESTISSLKDIQAKELREQFGQLDSAGERQTTPTRYITSQRPNPQDEKVSVVDGVERADDHQAQLGDAGAIDPFEFIEPADPLKSKDWPEDFDEKIASAKWLERKEVLAQCLKVLEATPKMIHSMSIDSFIDGVCERIKKDSNINVALVACQCLAQMATGLRNDFAKNKDKALPALLDKLKEKKESTVKVVSETLDSVFLTMSISDILEQTLNATKHKNPAIKSGSIQFLARCLKETRQMPAKADVKPMADAFVVAIGDGSAEVRDAGAQGLGTLMKLIGERPMNQYIDGLDDIKKGKIQEQYKEAIVKVKQAGPSGGGSTRPVKATTNAPAARPSVAPSTSKPSAATAVSRKPALTAALATEKENISPASTSAPARPPIKRPIPSTTTRPAVASASKPAVRAGPSHTSSAAAAGSKSAKAASSTEPVKFKFHPEEADAKAAEVVPSRLIEEIGNSVWKDRLAGMVKFNEWLKVEVEEVESELIVRFLSKKPGWKESNFQVMAEVYNSLRMLAQDCPTFTRPSVALSIIPLCEKLGDIKLKGPAGDTLTLYAEKTSFGFVLMQALTPLGNIKAPKAIADSLLWVNEAILAFGTAGVDVKSVIEYLLTCLKSANAGVRTNATTVIGTLARFLSSALTTFLSELNPQLRSTIEAEIEKATKEPAPTPTRFSQESRAKAESYHGGGSNGKATGAVDEDALDSLIPRVDLDQIMPSSVISRMSDANWKERKESLEEINVILDGNTRLKPNIGELGSALKLRYSDSNIQVRTLALDAISKIATAMNKGFADHARTFVPPITQVMADAKAPIRASATRTLSAIALQVGVGPMIPGFCSVLDSKVANPMLKQDLFTWLGEQFEAQIPEKGMDLTGLALPAILCLDDKLAAVRKAAQSVLPFIIMRAGYKFVMEQTNGLKAASRTTVVPLIDAAKAQVMMKQQQQQQPKASVADAAPSTRVPPIASTSSSKMPNIIKKQAYSSSSDGPISAPPSEALPDLPSTTPRKGLMKPPSVVGRSLKSSTAVIDGDDIRSATPRMNITKRSTLAPQVRSSSSAAQVAKSAPFISSDMKFKVSREKKESGSRGAYWIGPEATPRPELVEVLRHQCEHHLSVSLVDTMFSKDHNAERDYLSALTLLVDYVSNPESALEDYGLEKEEAVARVMANSDLIFKYIALRLTDNNTSISLKCLDLIENLIGLLRDQEYHMGDYEANAIIPCLIAKFGDPKPSFRDRIRQEIFRKLTFIYPPSKILSHYMEEGLPSKNARVRTECLAELGKLFNKNGPQVCSLPKVLPIIAQQISDRDNGVRTAALLAIGEVYKVVGEEETWKCVGKLPLKESSLLEERLRRTVAPATAPPIRAVTAAATSKLSAPEARKSNGLLQQRAAVAQAESQPAVNSSPLQPRKLPVPSRLARPVSMAVSGIQPPSAPKMSRLPGPVVSGIARPGTLRSVGSTGATSATSSSSAPMHPNGEHSNGQNHVSQARASDEDIITNGHSEARNTITTEEDVAVEQAINEILSSDSNRSVMALKQVDAEIQILAPALLRNADQLTIAFGKQLHRAFRLDAGEVGNDRLKKNLLFTGISIFDNTRLWEDNEMQRTLGSYVSKSALVLLLTELLQRLIETSGAIDEETQAHGRYLNIIVLRTFSSCNLNVLFGACLAMLTEATEDLEELRDQGDEVILQKRVRFSELIIKCLWKITRKLHASLQDEQIDATILLQDLERFMQIIPPNEWKRRSNIGLPLGEMPLRTIKVIITHIGSCFGEEALDLLDGIPNAEESHVYKFLLRVCDRSGNNNGLGVEEGDMVTEGGAATTATPSSPSSVKQINRVVNSLAQKEQHSQPSSYQSPSADKDNAEAAINTELRAIFDRIAQKSESRAAIKDLYLFQRRYPHKEANIQRSLKSTGPIFQKFIKRALANHAAEDDQQVSVGISNTNVAGAELSPSLDSVISSIDRRDSNTSLMSPNSARNSVAAIDWAATAASINRSSVMTPPSSGRTSFTATPLNPSSPSMTNTNSPGMQRYSASDDRLAQLRAKFARSTSGASDSSIA